MLCPSHSLLPVYAGKYLYVVYMTNMIYEIESNKLCFVVYLRVPHVLKLLLSTPMRDVKTLINELSYMYTVFEDHCLWSVMLCFFPLSYKFCTGVLSM